MFLTTNNDSFSCLSNLVELILNANSIEKLDKRYFSSLRNNKRINKRQVIKIKEIDLSDNSISNEYEILEHSNIL